MKHYKNIRKFTVVIYLIASLGFLIYAGAISGTDNKYPCQSIIKLADGTSEVSERPCTAKDAVMQDVYYIVLALLPVGLFFGAEAIVKKTSGSRHKKRAS